MQELNWKKQRLEPKKAVRRKNAHVYDCLEMDLREVPAVADSSSGHARYRQKSIYWVHFASASACFELSWFTEPSAW